MEGPEFRRRAEHDVEGLKRDPLELRVLARSSPSDKQNLVKLLESLHEKVAVAGDGTNDARAFKESSVGFAMGIDSSDVAREAADVVVHNEHVSSIPTVYLWSRRYAFSLYRYMVFRFNVSSIIWIVVLVCVCAGGEIPLNVHQLLCANFITDTLVVLAFATEKPPAEAFDNYRNWKGELKKEKLLVHMIVQSLYQIIVIFCTYYSLSSLSGRYTEVDHDVEKMRKNSLLFNMFILMQLSNSLNCRKSFSGYNIFEGLLDSPHSCWIRVVTIFLHVMIMVTPLRKLFDLSELNGWEWLYSMAVSFGVLAVGFITRYITN